MASQERYIDADALISKLRGIYVYPPCITLSNSYNQGSIDYALQNAINGPVSAAIQGAVENLKQSLIMAIEETATLKGTPCFLCKQRDGDEVPVNAYGGCGKATGT